MKSLLSFIRLHFQGLDYFLKQGIGASWRQVNRRDAHPLIQFYKYGVCGAAATVVQLVIALTLSYTVIPAIDGMIVDGAVITDETRKTNLIINNLIAFPFSNAVAYLLNVLWVFTPGRHSKLKEFGLFTGVSLFSLMVGLLGGPMLIKWFGIPSIAAQFGLVVTSALVNYVCRKFLIFLK